MQSTLDVITSDIAGIRTGRAIPSLVENIVCPAYGGTQRLKVVELATITAPDPSQIIINPYDKSIIGDIRKGIEQANLGMNPSIDGEIIRISMPPMTTEDREKYVKLLSGKLESGKIMIRQVRADEMHEIKKKFEEKEMTEDEKFANEKKLQNITDEFVGKIDEAGEKKKVELMQI